MLRKKFRSCTNYAGFCWEGHKYKVQCCMASHMKWHLPVQEEADCKGCSCSKNKVENITKRATRMHSTNLAHFYPTTPAKLGSTRLNTDYLATSNGICTKRNMAQFELLPFENEVNNNSQTWPLIHLTSLATFSSKILLLKWVMPVKKYYEDKDEYEYEQNGNFQFWVIFT